MFKGKPFNSRGIVLSPEPITDTRVYRAFGDLLCGELDCIPANVTKNPVAVGFGNTHNAPAAVFNDETDTAWITEAFEQTAASVQSKTTKRRREKKAERTEQNRQQRTGTGGGGIPGENISEFIWNCDAVGEMGKEGLLTHGRGNEYHWHESEHDRSCDILDGVIHIFSASMAAASPAGANEPVGAHRFYLYYKTGLDLARKEDQEKCREYLFEQGYGDDPKTLTPAQKRYTADPKHEHDTSDMETERAANKTAVEQWLSETEKKKGTHLLVLGRAAGTAKTTVVIFTVDAFLYVAQTTEEADSVAETLASKGEDVYRHRPRMFNRYHKDFDNNEDWHTLPHGCGEHERPCDQDPELCNLHAERLGTTHYICNPIACPSYAACQDYGFLSQLDREQVTPKVVYAWGEDFACDALLAEQIKKICSKGDILIVDEVNPLQLTQRRTLDREKLFDLTARFRHFHQGTADIHQKLQALLDLISTAETPETFIAGIKAWVDSIEDVKALDEKIGRYPVGVTFHETPENAAHEQPFEATLLYQDQEVTVPVVDFETGADTPVYFVDPETPIEKGIYKVTDVTFSFLLKVGFATLDDPPRTYRQFVRDLKTFIDENNDIETAPFDFNPKQQTFEFHLKPTLNHWRAIFNTASDPDNLIGEAYRGTNINVTREDGTPPAWKTDLVFQIASGAYLPRHSLVKYGEDKTLELKPRAQELTDDFILPSIRAQYKVLVVAPKAFQEIDSVLRWAVTDTDDFIPGQNAMLINHHHAEGRNDFQDFDVVFVFHYEPNHSEIQSAAKRLFRNPETPLDFTREEQTVIVGGVRFKKVVYRDPRVQAVYNRECRARLMQSGMRLRPNIHEGKIIVFLTAEPVDIPVTPVPVRPADSENFTGDWAAFREILHAQGTATENGDVPAVMETKGVSERTAYRQTQEARQQSKAARDAEIIRLHRAEKMSQREIERQLKQAGYTKVSRKAISKVLTRCKIDTPLLYSTNSAMSEMHHPTDPDDTGISPAPSDPMPETAEIHRRYADGETPTEIATAMGISRPSVSEVLAAAKF